MQASRWLTVLRGAALLLVVVLLLALPSSISRSPRQPASASSSAFHASLWRVILAAPLVVHGLAHLSGVAAPFTRRSLGFADQPWALTHGGTLHSASGQASSVAWLAAAFGLIGAGWGLLAGQAWWAALALAAASLSLAVILTWWKAVPPGAKVGAAFDVLILLAALQPVEILIRQAVG